MLYKGMVSKSKYCISEKIRVMSTQKRRKNPYARVLVLCQVPLETIMRVGINRAFLSLAFQLEFEFFILKEQMDFIYH